MKKLIVAGLAMTALSLIPVGATAARFALDLDNATMVANSATFIYGAGTATGGTSGRFDGVLPPPANGKHCITGGSGSIGCAINYPNYCPHPMGGNVPTQGHLSITDGTDWIGDDVFGGYYCSPDPQ